MSNCMDDWSLDDSPHFEAVFTTKEIEEAERNRQDCTKDMGITRRMALAFLTQSYDELREAVLNDESLGVAFIEFMDSIKESEEMAQADIEVYQAAQARIILVCGDIVKQYEEEEEQS